MAIIADDPAPVADMAVDEFLGTSPGPSWRRWLKWLAIAAAAVVLTILIGRFVSGGLATEYASEPVVRSDIRLGLFGTGRLQPVGARPVGSAQEGTVQEILVQENQPVSEGEVLARLDPAPFREARDRARELLDTRQAAVEKAHAAKADIDRRLALYQRVRRRSGGDVPSNREMAAARDAARRAADALNAAQVELAAARTDLAEREAQLASADIRSPSLAW
ncbi:MAG: biotin/lipoyl-binding protein [Sphingomonas bacterium]